MKPRHLAMGAALLLAAGLLVFGDNAPETEVAEPVERAAAGPAAGQAAPRLAEPDGGREKDGPVVQRLVPRDTLIGGADRFNADGQDAFGRQDWTPPPPPPEPAPPPPPPSAPPLPFTYIGKSLQDGVWQVYLAKGQRTYLVHDKDVIDGAYRVDAIKPPVLTLTYLPLDKVQQLNIGVFD